MLELTLGEVLEEGGVLLISKIRAKLNGAKFLKFGLRNLSRLFFYCALLNGGHSPLKPCFYGKENRLKNSHMT